MNVVYRALRSLLDCIFATRPVLLIPVWGFTSLGAFRALHRDSLDLRMLWAGVPVDTFPHAVLFSLSVAAVYLLNQLADKEVDRYNGGLPLVASEVVGATPARTTAALLAAAGILLPLFGPFPLLSLLSLSAIVLGVLYSFKPTSFSGRPIADFLTNATGYGIVAFGAGWYMVGGSLFEAEFARSALPYFLLMAAGSISSTLPDIEGDRICGKRTTAVVLGAARAHGAAGALLVAALCVSVVNRDVPAAICAVVPLPLYALHAAKRGKRTAEATYKVGGAGCMLVAGIMLPVMAGSAAVVFCATWLYFRFRHGVSYPSLEPARVRREFGNQLRDQG